MPKKPQKLKFNKQLLQNLGNTIKGIINKDQDKTTQSSPSMYDLLIRNDNDLLGMVAYCEYKKAKIEFIKSYTASHGAPPDISVLKDFQNNQCNAAMIESHRAFAANLIESVSIVLFSDALKQISDKEASLKTLQQELEKRNSKCPKNPFSFWFSVASSLLATILFGIVMIVSWLSGYLPSLFSWLSKISAPN